MIFINLKNILRSHAQFHRYMRISIALLLGLGLSLSLSTPSQAHWADLAVADIQIKQQHVSVNLTVPTGLVAQFDDDKNNQLSDSELTKHQTAIQDFLNQKIQLTSAGQKQNSLVIKSATAKKISANIIPTPDTHSNLLLQYQWTAPLSQLEMKYDLFVPGVDTARCLTQVFRDGKVDNIVFTPTSKTAALIDAPISQQITSFIGLGIEHIWTGYDHILFLISLLMLGGELGYLLKVVTAFSLSHSVTLFLAALNIVSVPSRWVEIAIALSIAYIASENLWKKQPQARWQLAFGFGLIHGLGFSSVLQELDLPRTNLLASIASFSVGIELGQFAIVLVVYFLLSYLRKFPWDLTIRRLISAGVIVMSAIWFWERAFMG
ncbi:HupE/UreJ family protein [Chamaesiphon sp. VAR_48_metabat_135_sub]|uniref:HupE/UreJ family protein n=1 Tax=Chamaesiphon sp. VAR_48_metabat_135_sub TaxID=2964699 RepID=UPI00286C9202|nr:HupE/UreJ family protein [Chamaesiphon sp. VAR_48_metabat_135_sub]